MQDREANHRIARLVASLGGLLGVLLAIATPLLPVDQTTAQLNWPQTDTFGSVDAPLIGYVATDLTITVPCQAAAGLTGGGNAGKTVLLSTVPEQAPKAVDRGLLIVRANDELVLVGGDDPVVSAPPSQVLKPACERVTFDRARRSSSPPVRGTDPGTQRRAFRSRRCAARKAATTSGRSRRRLHRSERPDPARAAVSATIDTRYSSDPTPLKMPAMTWGWR